jgi:thiamine pyrophosphate-dependent acetolactate synthase large subunit-like protein
VPSRTEIARAALDAAAHRGWPLFTGNGFLCREVTAQAGDPGKSAVLPLHGGMGLAGGVAAGYLLRGNCPGAIVLEGDGNHLMGWSCAQLIGSLALPVIHIVACNGSYESTGGQPLPFPVQPHQAEAAAAVLRYARGVAAGTIEELREALDQATAGPTLIYARQHGAEKTPPRSPFCTIDYADALSSAAAPHGATARPAQAGVSE